MNSAGIFLQIGRYEITLFLSLVIRLHRKEVQNMYFVYSVNDNLSWTYS